MAGVTNPDISKLKSLLPEKLYEHVNGGAGAAEPVNVNVTGSKTKFDILASFPRPELPYTLAVRVDTFNWWPKYSGSWILTMMVQENKLNEFSKLF